MPIYDKPTKVLMAEWAQEHLELGQRFNRDDAVRWFNENYPKLKSNTVETHVNVMSINNRLRKHHPSIKAGSGHDLFYKIDVDVYRLFDPAKDPAPRYKTDIVTGEEGPIERDDDIVEHQNDTTFAYERHLQDYLVRNLSAIEHGLTLYEDEGLNGVEFDAGGRRIDILAVDKDGAFVVIELKVGKSYDRVIGQLLFYKTWVKQNMESDKPVRGMIIGNEISDELKLATSDVPNVELVEYEISFALKTVQST